MSTGASVASDWESLARSAAGDGGGEEEQVLVRELLSFELAGTPYALPVERVREIVRLRDITPVPRVPREVLGVIALRGEVVEVVDLRMCLRLECRERTRRSRIIVLHGDDARVTGILVDVVHEVLRVPDDDVTPAVADGGAVIELCTKGDDFVSILDIDRVLDLDERER